MENNLVYYLKKIIEFGVYAILLTPLLIGPRYFFPFVGPKSLYFMGLVEIIFFAWLILIIYDHKYLPKKNVLLWAMIFYIGAVIASTLLGVDPSRSFWSKFERMTGLLMQLHLFAFFLVLSSTFKKKLDWTKIFVFSTMVASFISVLELLPKAGVNIFGNLLSATRSGATLGNSSFLASYLIFNVFLVLYLFFNSKGKIAKSIFGSLFVLLALALTYSTGRAAALSFFGGLVLLFVLWLVFEKKGALRLTGIILLVALILLAFGLFYLLITPGSFLQQYFIKIANESRFGTAKIAWKAFLARPWFGWGPENFELVFDKYFSPAFFNPAYGGEVWFDRAHNIVLDTLDTLGIIGLLAYLSIFFASFWIVTKDYFKKKIKFYLAGIFGVGLIAYFIQNLTVFDMVSSYMMFILVLGFLASKNWGYQEEREERKNMPRLNGGYTFIKAILIIFVSIAFLLSFFEFVIRPRRADMDTIKAMTNPTIQGEINLSKRALNDSPLGKYQIRDALSSFLYSKVRNQIGVKTPSLSRDDMSKALSFSIDITKQTLKESPLDFRAYLKLSQLYTVYALISSSKQEENDYLEKADEIAQKAVTDFPTNQQGYWALGQVKLYEGKYQDALDLAKKALDLEPLAPRSYLILIQVARVVGGKPLAEKYAAEAIKALPSLAPSIKRLGL